MGRPDIVMTGSFKWVLWEHQPGCEIWGLKHTNQNLFLDDRCDLVPCEATCAPEVIEDE